MRARRVALGALAASIVVALPAHAGGATDPAPAALAIVVRDQTVLRAAPRDAAQPQAQLWQGEVLEVRGERIDHLQVWDYRRERGGFVDASRVHRLALTPAEAPELLTLLRFVRDRPGSEALGIGFAAAYLKAAPAEARRGAGGAEAFDAIGTLADRLAQRASSGAVSTPIAGRVETALTAHLEVAARYGVNFKSYEREGVMRLCYDGEAFGRVLALPSDAQQRARAALGLTRPECIDPQTPVSERQRIDERRAEVLDQVDSTQLPKLLRNRVAMRRAGVWSSLAYQRSRHGEPAAEAAAKRALVELAAVERGELADDDFAAWNSAAIRVGASRWAAAPLIARPPRSVSIVTAPGEPGQTCVALIDSKHDASAPLVRRCTYGVVWADSATLNREGNALTLAVQPLEAWRELWLFRKQAGAWAVQVLPPSTAAPSLGYVEFAGWVPGGKQMLVAREARSDRGLRRSFEIVRLETLASERQSADPSLLGPFRRWQDPGWKRETVSVR